MGVAKQNHSCVLPLCVAVGKRPATVHYINIEFWKQVQVEPRVGRCKSVVRYRRPHHLLCGETYSDTKSTLPPQFIKNTERIMGLGSAMSDEKKEERSPYPRTGRQSHDVDSDLSMEPSMCIAHKESQSNETRKITVPPT